MQRGPGRRRDRRREVGRQRARGRDPPDDEAVVVVDLRRDPRPAELLGPAQAVGRHLGREVAVGEQPLDRVGELLGVPRRHQQRLAAAPDDALVAVDVRGDDRRAGGHRLQQDDPERLAPGRRRDVDVRGLEQLVALRVRDAAQELDAAQPARGDVPPRLALLRAAADEQQPGLAAVAADDPVRLEDVEDALAGLEPPDEQHVRRPVLPARQRHGPPEAVEVDAVRDHLVVAREVAVDEVPRGRGHRDPAVEALGVALHRPAAELVRGRPAAIRVERAHVDALRLAQDHERQERHERLVEVEDVEPLVLQQRPHLGHEPGRDGHRPDRPVGRHREPLAEADDVALGGPLEAVGRGEDADGVAAQAEVLVQVVDVLGHAAGERVDVRRDEPDLHRPAPSPGSNTGGRRVLPG